MAAAIRSALVTGGGGFIGSHLVERLVREGVRTRALVHYNSSGTWGWLDGSPLRNDVEVVAGDVQDAGSVKAAVQGVDVVFHLAALIAIPYSYRAPVSYLRTNAEGTLNVMQAALDAGATRVVHTSTSEVYGTASRVPMDEGHPQRGQSPYSASKIAADKVAESWQLAFGLPVVTVRPFNTYGPRQSARAVLPTIITQALTHPVIKLGSLAPTRDFNFVADTVDGFLKAATAPGAVGGTFNLGTGREISVGDAARLVLKLVGKDLPLVEEQQRVRPATSEVDRLCADASRAREVLGWSPSVSLEDGLAQTLAWTRSNLERFRTGSYAV